MANNYRQFSAELCGINQEEAEWLKAEMRGPTFEPNDADVEKHRTHCIAWANEHRIELADEDPIDFFEYAWPDFDWEIADGDLWVHDNGEYGNVENVVHIVRRFLRKFKRKDAFVLEWAETCSKPRIGEFGGGGVVVTAKETKWFVPSDMIRKYLDKREKRGKK